MASTSLMNCSPQKMMSPPVMMGNSPPVNNYLQMNTTPSRGSSKRSIQPASTLPMNHSPTAAKKRIQFSSLGYVLPPPPPASVARRNARERNRVKQVNMGFAILRQHIPSSFGSSSSSRSSSSSGGGKSRKVSKVDTLRCAVEYIRSLQELLDDHENAPSSSASTSSENMSPPANVNSDVKPSFTYHGTSAGEMSAHHHSGTSLSPSCSDASSPTPSYGSEHSYFTASSWDPYDTYEAYEAPDLQDSAAPNDDELLDAISWWQQSQ